MNIKLSYLYRDASNYKQYNQIIFGNPNQRSLEEIQTIIRSNLIDECWFIAKDWQLPDMHFKEYSWDTNVDHEWHELECVEETTDAKTVRLSIDAFIKLIDKE
jgi:hypothetical protein